MIKISELNDEDVLNFLMTSEFEGDYSPAELKYLLVKWRYFFRLFQGRSEQSKMNLEDTILKVEEQLEIRKKSEFDLQVELAKKEDLFASIKNRDLTFKERWTGKIITKDENREI
jgi:hypothetical protein